MCSPRNEFLSGVKAELPLLIGVFPFGMIYGVLALSAGIPAGAAQAMSAIVFAGSSQLVATQLFAINTPGVIIVLTIAVVNLRHALYSASVAPYVKHLSTRWKWLLAYLLTDEAYAATIIHYDGEENRLNLATMETATDGAPIGEFGGDLSEAMDEGLAQSAQPPGNKHWFFLGAGLALWSTWQVSTAAGIFLGAVIPSSWSLDFTLALTFIALVVPALKDWPSRAAALSAGFVAVLAYAMPYKLGLMLAALVGILVGVWSERQK